MKKVSLYAQVWFVVAVLVVGSAAIAMIGLNKLEAFDHEVDAIVSETAVKVEIATAIEAYINRQLYLQQTYIISNAAEEMNKIEGEIKKTEEELATDISEYQKMAHADDAKTLKQFDDAYIAWLNLSKEVRKHAFGGDDAKAVQLFQEKGHAIKEEIIQYSYDLAELNKKKMSAAAETLRADYQHARMLIIFISLGVGLLSGLIAFAVLARLKKSVSTVLSDLSESSRHVAVASHQIASSSEELAQAASEQANSLEEAVGALAQVNTMLNTTSQNAHEAAKLADGTCQAALQGEAEIRTLSQSIAEISADSKKISEIIHVIDDIAFQINVLALNAAVEAARAGEQGRGFAVVADAVRGLAQKSAAAANDITALITGSAQKIAAKTQVADQSVLVLKSVVDSAKKVADINSEIARAFENQAEGLSQVSKAMVQIDMATQTNAATSEEAAAAAEELAGQSDAMNRTLFVLEETINGAVDSAKESSSSEMASVEPLVA